MQQKITFSEVCNIISTRIGIPRCDVDAFLRTLFSTMSEALSRGETVRLKGIGSFKIAVMSERKSIDVNTGKVITLPSHTKISFSPSKNLASSVNAPFAAFEAVELADNITEEDLAVADNNITSEAESEADIAIYDADTQAEKGENSNTLQPVISSSESEIIEQKSINSPVENIPLAPLAPFIASEKQDSDSDNTEYIEGLSSGVVHKNNSEQQEAVNETATPEEDNNELSESVNQTDEYVLQDAIYSENTEDEEVSSIDSTDEIHYNEDHTQESEYISHDNLPEDQYSDTETIHPSEIVEPEENEIPLRRNSHRHQKHSRFGFITGFMCALLLITVAGILILILCPTTAETIKEHLSGSSTPVETTDTSIRPTIVPQPIAAQTSNIDTIKNGSQTTIDPSPTQSGTTEEPPTQPSDTKKVFDVVTTTRYLTTIARQHYGNQHFWPYIYEENKAILGHPNRIKPGTKVIVPDLGKYGVNPKNATDIATAKRKEAEIYARYDGNSNTSKTKKK